MLEHPRRLSYFSGVFVAFEYPPMLPLTLRPTGIGTPPAFQHLKDYCIFEDGEKIG